MTEFTYALYLYILTFLQNGQVRGILWLNRWFPVHSYGTAYETGNKMLYSNARGNYS